MATLNQCQFIENVGLTPEVRYSQSGDAICSFSIAVNETWRDKTTGEKKESTEWVRIVAYRKLAEICGEYLKKGTPIWVQGKMKTRKWQGQDGQDRYTTEIIADQMQMLGGRGDSDQSKAYQQSAPPQQQSYAQQSGGHTRQAQHNYQAPSSGMADMDDDIPFAPLFARNAYCI